MELVPYSGIGRALGATGSWEPVPAPSELSVWACKLSRDGTHRRRGAALRAVRFWRDAGHEGAFHGRVVDLDVEPGEHGIEAELQPIHEHHALGQRHEIAAFLEHDLLHFANLEHQSAHELARDPVRRGK